ncbi:MAG: hypothetical protein IPM61_16855 [Chlorobi bacterium]|nr:hypothetical protein [Chlorobiota bacterium]
MAALLAGQSVSEVAADYKIDRSLVSRWKQQIPADRMHQVALKKQHDFGELLSEYLATLLTTLKVQAEVAGDPDYIRKQPAAELATLHGVMADKGIRLLEAASRDGDGE